MSATVQNTYGALLLGAFMACYLSGIVTVQSIIYFKLYPEDPARTKSIVCNPLVLITWQLTGNSQVGVVWFVTLL